MVSKVLFESRSEEWETPQALFNYLDGIFHFTLDPCANDQNFKCAKYFTKEQDGLRQDWSHDVVFVNPPYGRDTAKWVKKSVQEMVRGATVVLLIAARTDTKWWHDWVCFADEVWFLKGRVKFEGGKYSSTFPSVVVVFRPNSNRMKMALVDWKY